jgi:hypothetical protein
MSTGWSPFVQSHAMNECYLDNLGYEEFIEHDGQFGAHSLQALASGLLNDKTPKPDCDMSQGYIPAEYSKSAQAGYSYEPTMSTPPLSPSTTISSLQTDEHSEGHYSSDEQSLLSQEDREQIRRGKQPAIPSVSVALF